MHKTSAVAALLLAAAISPALAIVKFPIARRNDLPANHISRRALKRRGTITESLANNHTSSVLYLASVSVGTPGQTIALDIDTGSSDVYVIASTADECTEASVEAQYGGCFGGTFDATKSSTFKDVTDGFQVSYGDGTGASGDFVTDDFAIGGATISNLIMGLVNVTTTGSGLMGIGYDTDENIVASGAASTPYKSIIDTMVDQNLIGTKSYSLYLDDQTAGTGSVIFGGADTGKFIGPMKVMSIVPEDGEYREMLVTLSGITINNQTGSNTPISSSYFPTPILLDSGTSLTFLPDDVFSQFASAFGAEQQDGSLVVDCGIKNSQSRGYVTFNFGDSSGTATINVPIDELIQPIPGDSKNCLLGVMAASDSTFILGDVFLRSAYVIYDLTHNQIGLAQTNFESTASTIVEFKSTDSGLPTLTGQASGTTVEPGSKSGAVASVTPSEKNALLMFTLSALFTVLGGAWFLA